MYSIIIIIIICKRKRHHMKCSGEIYISLF